MRGVGAKKVAEERGAEKAREGGGRVVGVAARMAEVSRKGRTMRAVGAAREVGRAARG